MELRSWQDRGVLGEVGSASLDVKQQGRRAWWGRVSYPRATRLLGAYNTVLLITMQSQPFHKAVSMPGMENKTENVGWSGQIS